MGEGQGRERQGAMGSKHLRLAIALITVAYADEQLGAEARQKLDSHFTDLDLRSDAMGQLAQLMKWRTFNGEQDGALELPFAPNARDVDTILTKLLLQNGGRDTQGTAPRGPAIRKIDERISDTWRKTRADGDA